MTKLGASASEQSFFILRVRRDVNVLLAAIDETFDGTLNIDAGIIVGSDCAPSKFRINVFPGNFGYRARSTYLALVFLGLSIAEYVLRLRSSHETFCNVLTKTISILSIGPTFDLFGEASATIELDADVSVGVHYELNGT